MVMMMLLQRRCRREHINEWTLYLWTLVRLVVIACLENLDRQSVFKWELRRKHMVVKNNREGVKIKKCFVRYRESAEIYSIYV